MGDNPFGSSRPYPQSVVGRSPLEVGHEAARLSAISVAGGTLTPEQQGVLSFATERGLVEPLNFPTTLHGVPVQGQQRTMSVLQNMAPALRGDKLDIPGALGTIPPLPPSFPDIQLPEHPPSLAAREVRPLSLEQIFELMRAPRRL